MYILKIATRTGPGAAPHEVVAQDATAAALLEYVLMHYPLHAWKITDGENGATIARGVAPAAPPTRQLLGEQLRDARSELIRLRTVGETDTLLAINTLDQISSLLLKAGYRIRERA